MSPIVAEELQTSGSLRRDPGGLVITEITLDSSEVGVGAAENRPGESSNVSKQFCHCESKPKAKPNGELEADRVCQGDLICCRTERVARAPILDWSGQQRGGRVLGWSDSFQIGFG